MICLWTWIVNILIKSIIPLYELTPPTGEALTKELQQGKITYIKDGIIYKLRDPHPSDLIIGKHYKTEFFTFVEITTNYIPQKNMDSMLLSYILHIHLQ